MLYISQMSSQFCIKHRHSFDVKIDIYNRLIEWWTKIFKFIPLIQFKH